MGFLEIVTLILVILKLVGVLTWSWLLVLSPLLLSLAIYAILLLLTGGAIVTFIVAWFTRS